jgi:hypothetical protein
MINQPWFNQCLVLIILFLYSIYIHVKYMTKLLYVLYMTKLLYVLYTVRMDCMLVCIDGSRQYILGFHFARLMNLIRWKR